MSKQFNNNIDVLNSGMPSKLNIFVEKISNKSARVQPNIIHIHDFYELYYLVSGNRDYVIDGEIFNLKNDCIALIQPGQMHKTEGGIYERILIQFREEFLYSFFNATTIKMLLECFNNNFIKLPKSRLENIKFLALIILKDYNNENTALLSLHIAELLVQLSQCINECTQEKSAARFSDERIAAIIKYINVNFSTIEKIEEISSNIYINKYFLCHFFKEQMGISLITYINNIKIYNAIKMLKETNKSVTEIGILCGFNSPVHFCNTFKKNNGGMSPHQYRLLQKRLKQ